MSVFAEILKEEIQRRERAINALKAELEKLPRGTIFVRKMHNNCFVYRKRKENGKVISEYIGKLNSQESNIAIQRSEEYRLIKQQLRNASIELARLKEAIKAYERK